MVPTGGDEGRSEGSLGVGGGRRGGRGVRQVLEGGRRLRGRKAGDDRGVVGGGAGRRDGWAGADFCSVVHVDAADHDAVLLDRDLDRAMPRPVLGVDRIVLDRGIEPQPVALLGVVERALEGTHVAGRSSRSGSACAIGARPTSTPTAAGAPAGGAARFPLAGLLLVL